MKDEPDAKTGSFHPSSIPHPSSFILHPSSPTAPIAALSTQRGPKNREFYGTAARLIADAADALEHAHSLGIVHRDVKPGNLLVDQAGKVYVADFGLARFSTDAGLTISGDLLGTLRYMAPEQAMARHGLVDHRADVYGLGCTLYELLTGRPAVGGEDKADILRHIAFEEPVAPRKLGKAIPAELETVTLKTLAKEPQGRYATAGELAEDLRHWLEDKPIRARPASPVQRARRWARTHRTLAWSAAVAISVAAVTLAGGAGYLVRDRSARLAAAGQKVAEVLAGARTAIEAGNLALAGQRVAEAQGYLGSERERLPDAAAAIDQARQDIDARLSDEERLQRFRHLATDAQDKMSSDNPEVGERIALDALALYDVLAEDDWLLRLERSTLTAGQTRQVRETAYVILVSLADSKVRWFRTSDDPRSIQYSLDLLRRAEAFHPPTRAFYFVRSVCHRKERNKAAADEDMKRYDSAAALTAWDYYLPGHSAGWDGDVEEAIRSYRKALLVQPDHYNSMYFLALRLSQKKKEYAEAIGLFTGCIALRPDHIYAYKFRAQANLDQGRRNDAEADFSAAITAAKDEKDRIIAYGSRQSFFKSEGRTEQAKQEAVRLLALAERQLERWTTIPGSDPLAMGAIAHAYQTVGRREEAVTLYELTLARRRTSTGSGPNHPDTLAVMHNLAHAYQQVGRLPDAVNLFEQSLEKTKAAQKPDESVTLKYMSCLAMAYHDAGQFEQAEGLFRGLLEDRRKKNPESADTAGMLAPLGWNLLKQERYAEAEALLRECLAIRETKEPHDWATFNTQSMLGGALLGQKKYTDAEPLLLQGYEGMRQREAKIPAPGKGHVTEALERLVQHYEATDHKDKAAEWQKKLESARDAAKKPQP